MDEVIGALSAAMESALSEVNTMVPGTIVEYDPDTNFAVVLPSLPKRLADGSALPAPKIVSVPVLWPGATTLGAALTFPLKPGDGVKLVFAQRSLEGWLSGGTDAPDDPRMFDLTDAVAVPGLAASGVQGHADNVVLRFGQASITITPEGAISLGNPSGSLTLGADGKITIHSPEVKSDGDIVATNTVSLTNHVHTQVQPGSGNSGVPQK